VTVGASGASTTGLRGPSVGTLATGGVLVRMAATATDHDRGAAVAIRSRPQPHGGMGLGGVLGFPVAAVAVTAGDVLGSVHRSPPVLVGVGPGRILLQVLMAACAAATRRARTEGGRQCDHQHPHHPSV